MENQYRLYHSLLKPILLFVIVIAAFTESAGAVSKPVRLTYGSTGLGGTPYIFSSAISEAMKKGLPQGSSIMISSGGGYENLARLEKGDVEIAHQTTLSLFAGIRGEKPFTAPIKNARLLSGITPPTLNEFNFVIEKACPVDSFEDIRNKKYPLKLATRTLGVAGEVMTDHVFRAYGFSYDDVKKWGGSVVFTSSSGGYELLKDGRVEAFSASHTYPAAMMVDLCKDRGGKLKWLSIEDGKVLSKLEEEGMYKVVLPKGHYGPSFDKEIVSICGPEVIAVSANVPDDLVYTLIKAMCEGADLIRTSHPSVSDFSPENAYRWAAMFTKYVPFHPGAEKYFKEKGYIK